MSGSNQRGGFTLTLRLCAALCVGALGLSVLVTLAAAEGSQEQRVLALHRHQAELCAAVAKRAAPLLERGDDLRLSVLATSVADLVDGRVLLVDAGGRVRIDTAVALGGQEVPLEALEGAVQRKTAAEDGSWEVLAPALGSDGFAGEARVRYRTESAMADGFPWSLLGLVFLCSISIITLAGWISHAWVQRVREVTRHAQSVARGGVGADVRRLGSGGAVDELADAVMALTAASADAASRARESCLSLAREVVHALELRGHVPTGHPERTRELAMALAKELELPDGECADLAEAALLLDLGKAGVRPTALTKATGLSDLEQESFRQHPLRAAALLSSLPGFDGIATAIRHQHEKWDGAGFPDGLRGDRIPATSRLLAIVSAYDLMTTGSVYGRPMSWPDAIDRLREDRGEHFDPDFVDAFERLIRRRPPRTSGDDGVTISTVGVLPYRAVHGDPAARLVELEDDAEDEILAYSDAELEVVFDDVPEDRA